MDESAIASKVYEEQKEKNWPGLACETALLCQALDIEDCNIRKLGKKIYRKILIEACHRKNEANLRTHAKGKCERINDEQYGKKEYYPVPRFPQ